MQKKKISLKTKIFAFVGIFVALLSLFTLFVSADDMPTYDQYTEIGFIPYYPTYSAVPTYYETHINGTSSKVPLFEPNIIANFVSHPEVNEVYDENFVFPAYGGLYGKSNTAVSVTSGNNIFTNLHTNIDYAGSTPNFHSSLTISPRIDYLLNEITIFAEDFWLYPRTYDNTEFGGDTGISDQKIIDFTVWNAEAGDTTVDFSVYVTWEFLANQTVYSSWIDVDDRVMNGNTSYNINYQWLISNAKDGEGNRILATDYRYDVASPIHIHEIEIVVNGDFDGSTKVLTKIPAMKDVEHSLIWSYENYILAIGKNGQTVIVDPMSFDISMLFEAVSEILAIEFIPNISFAALLTAFICLAVVLAVYAMFRGST